MKDPYRYFRVEARELADGMARSVLEWERDPEDREEVVRRLLRLAHTLKGAARVVGQAQIAEEAHAFEDAVAAHRAGPRGVDDLLARVDAVSAHVAALEAAAAPPAEEEPPAPSPAPAVAEGDELDLLLAAHQDARAWVGALRRGVERVEALRRQVEGRPLGPDAASALHAGLLTAARELAGALSSLDGELGRVGVHAHALRLVPAETVFAPLARAARDTARALGKRVVFEARGGDCHLDGRVLAALRGALLHLVHNAVDHGIEGAAEREASGKHAAGRVEIEVTRRGQRVTFVCRDDGRGIDVEAVRRSAVGRALSPAADATRLIFEPGLSTRAEVTPISGRGVGLDTVRDIAARLKGTVAAESEPGRGAAFSITVPVSLSSMPVLAVEAGELRAAVPLDAVRCVLRLAEGGVSRLGEREAIVVEGRAVPLLRLDEWAGATPALSGAPRCAVIVADGGGVVAVGVDRLLGAAQVIVQPLSPLAGAVPVLGASFDLDGTPEPVLEPGALVAAPSTTRCPRPAPAPAPAPRSVLVIDDSLTTQTLERSILESAGYRVEVATSGEEGLEKARAAPYDLFIADVEMPGMSGFDFVATARREPALAAVPSIIVSSRGDDADRRRGAEAGARAYVAKHEFAQEGFLEIVRGLLR